MEENLFPAPPGDNGGVMKLLLCVSLLLLPQMSVHASLLTHNDAKLIRSHMSGRPQSSELMSLGRQRPLFARRVYERQRIYEMRPRLAQTHPKGPPPKETQSPGAPKCCKVSETCLPNSHCCDPCAVCRCRFFNAVCFCRKTSSCKKRS